VRIPLSEAIKQVPQPDGRRWAALFQHGTLEVEIYAPRGNDPQQPHKKDEVYVVAQGSGEFVCGGERVKFVAGDLLFVPAGETHRFENFSADFTAWVIFYGPEGGEARS
jgi:mannose-6-phosphate isomerase-like protein (cupin superfamily)